MRRSPWASWPAPPSCLAARPPRSRASVTHGLAGTGASSSRPARSGIAPRVTAVDLRAELAAGNRGLISEALAGALSELDRDRGDRAILVINRRGTASVVMCRDCGHVQACPDCERPLVYHHAGTTLRCHHCGRAWPPAARCPACRSPRIRYLGGGTERVEREVRGRFRTCAWAAWTATSSSAGARPSSARRLHGWTARCPCRHQPGHQGPRHPRGDAGRRRLGGRGPQPARRARRGADVPAARAGGRARWPGRAAGDRAHPGPTSPEHRAIRRGRRRRHRLLRRGAGDAGAVRVAAVRPPDQAQRRARGPRGRRTRGDGDGRSSPERAAALALPIEVVGPAPAYVARRAERWRYNVVLRGPEPAALLDPPPGAPWSIDVDPESLL